MSYYFDRDDVALHGIAKWLKKQSDEEREHGTRFMKFQNTRGGRIVLQNIQACFLIYISQRSAFMSVQLQDITAFFYLPFDALV
jgi:ferritin